MKKIEKFENIIEDGLPLPAFRRIVLLTPDVDLDEICLARRLRSMMPPSKSSILLLSLLSRGDKTNTERRRLANLAAVLRDPSYSVSSLVLENRDWSEQLQSLLQPADLLVITSEPNRQSLALKQQLSLLASSGKISCRLYELKNVTIQKHYEQSFLHELAGWLVSITVIILFMGIDIRIVQSTVGWFSNLLLLLVLSVEIGLIMGWNNIWG